LFEFSKGKAVLFNGKIYYNNNLVYNLKTNKVSTKIVNSPIATKNYMYYINSNDSIIIMDKQGKEKTLDTKVSSVLGGNENKNVIFSKVKNNVETYYRCDSKGKIIKLTTKSNVGKLRGVKGKKNLKKVVIDKAVFVNGKVVFSAAKGDDYLDLVSVSNKGGKVKNLVKSFGEDLSLVSLTAKNKSIYYTIKHNGESTQYLHYIKKVK
jgi:hypothetical protein